MVRHILSFPNPLTLLPNLRFSSLGLPKSFQQDRNHVTLHDRIQTIWIQCVPLILLPNPLQLLYPLPSSHRRIFHEHRHSQLCRFRR